DQRDDRRRQGQGVSLASPIGDHEQREAVGKRLPDRTCEIERSEFGATGRKEREHDEMRAGSAGGGAIGDSADCTFESDFAFRIPAARTSCAAARPSRTEEPRNESEPEFTQAPLQVLLQGNSVIRSPYRPNQKLT